LLGNKFEILLSCFGARIWQMEISGRESWLVDFLIKVEFMEKYFSCLIKKKLKW
jgi:hypothetical protein